jgi:hypothetical protein
MSDNKQNRMNASEYIFNKLCKMKSDINEHLQTLANIASYCEVVAELGVRDSVSTWAFIQGLKHNNKDKKLLYSVDIDEVPDLDFVLRHARRDGVKMTFFHESSLKVVFPTELDMVFIDTWHIYAQLKRELNYYGPITKKYIVMHDTEVDKVTGEVIRLGGNVEELSMESGFPEEEVSKGLGPAIVEFLTENSETWRLREHYKNNNGLTILERIDPNDPNQEKEMVKVFW